MGTERPLRRFFDMEHSYTPRKPRAVTAIAAVIALHAAPVFAQDVQTDPPAASSVPIIIPASPAAPVITPEMQAAPPEVITPPAAPVIVLPEVAPSADADEALARPQATAVRERAAPAAPAAARTVAAPDEGNAEAPRVETAPAVPTAEATGTASDGVLAEGALPAGAAAPAPRAAPAVPVGESATSADAIDSGDVGTAGVLGLLAAVGIAGIGAVAMMRRRRKEPPLANEPIDGPSGPVTSGSGMTEVEPVPVTTAAPLQAPASSHAAYRPTPAVALVSGPVPSDPESRRELLEAMVSAPPDASNPFTSRKARMRRARIQLQHREHQSPRGEDFDWRTYKPVTATSTPASPEPVTA